mgnify:CR=1 FL=1
MVLKYLLENPPILFPFVKEYIFLLTCCQCHQSPPKTVNEGPTELFGVFFGIEDQTGKGQDRNSNQND